MLLVYALFPALVRSDGEPAMTTTEAIILILFIFLIADLIWIFLQSLSCVRCKCYHAHLFWIIVEKCYDLFYDIYFNKYNRDPEWCCCYGECTICPKLDKWNNDTAQNAEVPEYSYYSDEYSYPSEHNNAEKV